MKHTGRFKPHLLQQEAAILLTNPITWNSKISLYITGLVVVSLLVTNIKLGSTTVSHNFFYTRKGGKGDVRETRQPIHKLPSLLLPQNRTEPRMNCLRNTR